MGRGGVVSGAVLTDSQRRWVRVRRHLAGHRHALAVRAFADFGVAPPAGDAPLLVRPEWLPAGPVPLADVRLEHRAGASVPMPAAGELPVRPDGRRYERYSEALAELAPPAVLHDLPTYRLLAADLRDRRRLAFGDGRYFDGLDTGEAAAHEYAAVDLGQLPARPLRAAIGDPTDLTRRPANVAVSTLTLRYDRATGAASMPLHRRNTTVGHAAGMIQVIPVGVFQPLGPEPWHVANDLSLWRGMLREYAEELLGADEEYGAGPFDYAGWPFGARMTAAADAGLVRPYLLGLGVDPLTFATDLLAAVVFDAEVYDELFAAAVAENAEGRVLPAVPFDADQVERYAGREPTQAAGAAVLRLAWRHRAALLG